MVSVVNELIAAARETDVTTPVRLTIVPHPSRQGVAAGRGIPLEVRTTSLTGRLCPTAAKENR